MTEPRGLWARVETLHAVTYFSEESRAAARDCGLRGFWMGYFGFRAAPLGAVGADDVVDAFFGFAPAMVRRSIPDAWAYASPEVLLDARAAAAAAALRAHCPGIDGVAERVNGPLTAALVGRDDEPGAPLFSANLRLALPDDPVARLWQICTTVREHRGDHHVAAWRASGMRPLDVLALFVADSGIPRATLADYRGWTDDEWSDAATRLRERALADDDGGVTDAGRDLRARVEAATDAATADLLGTIDDGTVAALGDAAAAVAASGVLPYPNPIGLPRVNGD